MHLYHLTTRRSDSIDAATVCAWNDATYYVLGRGSWIEMYRITDDGELCFLNRQNWFVSIRCLETLVGNANTADRVLATTTDGNLLAFKFNKIKSILDLSWVHRIGGKLKRDEAGEYLITDYHGRIASILGIERARTLVKFAANIEDSSTIEISLPFTYCYTAIGLNRGFDSPAFAVLERFRYQEKQLAVYEFNMGLNLLVKQWTLTVPEETNFMIEAGRDLVAFTDQSALLIREGAILSKSTLQSTVLCASKITDDSVLVHSVDGTFTKIKVVDKDLKREDVAIQIDDEAEVYPRVQFKELIFSGTGHVLGIAEYGDHVLFQVTSLSPVSLNVSSRINNIAPVTASALQKQGALLGCGGGIVEMQSGLASEVLVSTHLPFTPTAVFSTKRSPTSNFHDLIVLSRQNMTTVLEVSVEGAVEEIGEALTGISANVTTLGIRCLRFGLLQIHETGLRYIKSTPSAPKILPWKANSGLRIVAQACTDTQLALAFSNRQLIYFEEMNGELSESQQRLDLSENVTSLAFSYSKDLKSEFLFIALEDETIKQFAVPKFKQTKLLSIPYLCSSLLEFRDVLYIGHYNGAFSEVIQDELRTKVLGSQPVKLIQFSDSVLSLSSNVWQVFPQYLPIKTRPQLLDIHGFFTEDLNGLLGITDSSLEVFDLTSNSEFLNETITLINPNEPNISYISRLRGKELSISKYHVCCNDAMYVSAEKIKFGTVVRFGTKECIALAISNKIVILELDLQMQSFVLVHETNVDGDVTAILPFKQKLLVAITNRLLLFDLGRKQLLRQTGIALNDMKHIRVLNSLRDVVYLGDSRRSVTAVRYDGNNFHIIACDPIPRSVTCMCILDPRTVCCGDQFGNIAILRLGDQALHGKSEKVELMELVAHFTIPDSCISLHKGNLSHFADTESIIYFGIQGTIGVLIPFLSIETFELISKLEHLAFEAVPVDHKQARGGAAPRKNVIDGDLCELYDDFEEDIQLAFAQSMEVTPQALKNQLNILRSGSI